MERKKCVRKGHIDLVAKKSDIFHLMLLFAPRTRPRNLRLRCHKQKNTLLQEMKQNSPKIESGNSFRRQSSGTFVIRVKYESMLLFSPPPSHSAIHKMKREGLNGSAEAANYTR